MTSSKSPGSCRQRFERDSAIGTGLAARLSITPDTGYLASGGPVLQADGSERKLVAIAYPIAFLLIVLPLVEFTLTIWPLRPGGLMWRYGSFGLMSQALMLPTLGAFALVVTAYVLGHRPVLRILSFIGGVMVLIYAAGLLVFVLDGVQARAVAVDQMKPIVAATLIRTVLGMMVYLGVWSWMTLMAFRLSARRRPEAATRDRGPGLISVSPSDAAAATAPREQ